MSIGWETALLIFALALGTYATRVGGYLLLSRFERLDPRVEAALDAVPAAVLTALVTPVAFASGVAESVATAVVIAAALWLPILPTLAIAACAVASLRALGF